MLKDLKLEDLLKEVTRRQGSLVDERRKLVARIAEIDQTLKVRVALNGAGRLLRDIETPRTSKPRPVTRKTRARRLPPGMVRRAVIEALEQGPGRAAEVRVRMRGRVRGMGGSSVCWALTDLVRVGKAKRTGTKGSYRYELVQAK